MEIKDFKVGQTVYIELTGNASRGKRGDELIQEWEIVTVGKKYIHAKRKGGAFPVKFEMRERRGIKVFVEKTNTCVDYVLYPTRQELEDKLEKERLFDEVSKFFRGYGINEKITLEQLREIKLILSKEREGEE